MEKEMTGAVAAADTGYQFARLRPETHQEVFRLAGELGQQLGRKVAADEAIAVALKFYRDAATQQPAVQP
jgi:hypothetical protein